MSLIFCFAILFGLGEAAAFMVGVGVEYQFGEFIGMIAFFAVFVAAIVIAWKTSLRLTEPKAT